MIAECDRYILLVTSLPRLPFEFYTAKKLPISRPKLERRLQLLAPGDAARLSQVEAIAAWSGFNGLDDETIIDRCRETRDLFPETDLRLLVDWHLEMRTLISLMRIRLFGIEKSTVKLFLQFSQWAREVEENWHLDDFGLKRRVPWLTTIYQLLQSRDSLQLEKFLLELSWNQYVKIADRHHFDFTAVVAYLLRWNLIETWLSYDGTRAVARFERLADDVLAAHETT